MRVQAEPRVPKRLPCDVTVEGLRHSGLVLNVSPRGLFVQTNAVARPGSEISIDLTPPNEKEAVEVRATVVWKRAVPRQMLAVARGGMGLRITEAPEKYFSFLSGVIHSSVPISDAPLVQSKPATAKPVAARADVSVEKSAAKTAAKTPLMKRLRFRVRVSQVAGPRSRYVKVEATNPQQATRLALKEVGDGWQAHEVKLS